MTRAELVAALRERVAALRPEFPEVVARARTVSDDAVLEANSRCGACLKFHVQPAELVALAAQCQTMEDWLARSQALALERFPARCRRAIERLERLIVETRSN